jgi:DNA polymerase-3 subunit gamma/tau
MTDSPDDDAGPGFDLGEPAPRPQAPGYRVLARAYRPQTFAELIGQEAMVRTLANAIRRERLPHAFLMTGVRGVGKTSTARLIAKALNCVGPDGQGGPTIDPCGRCEPCRAIAEGRHIDVIEMDAASHTGVDDVREIIEAVRYAAVSARFKIYIIDEVHMLSRNAFNALLKTLEEPPEHVKFLFATTEVNKVPVTVLSRCQRFDLRRIPVELLVGNFRMICGKEGVDAEDDALRLIATAAEGSARDGQSILDQAIAHAAMQDGRPQVRADQVREMLGLSDRGATRRLLDQILDGDAPAMLATLAEQEALGVEPVTTMNALLELIHAATTAKAGRGAGLDRHAEAERAALAGWAEQISFPVLHRLWQLLLKGHGEVAAAARPQAACEMALLRLIHAATMPDPLELARMIREGGPAAAGSASPVRATPPGPTAGASEPAGGGGSARLPAPGDAGTAEAPAGMAPRDPALPADFAAMVALLRDHHPRLGAELHDYVSPVRYAPPVLAFRLLQPLDADFPRQVAAALRDVTGEAWVVETSDAPGEPSLLAQQQAAAEARQAALRATPVVAAVLESFPDARFVEPGGEQSWSEKR